MKKKTEQKREVRDLPHLELRADLADAPTESDERIVDATFYTGAEVMREFMFDEPMLLSFKMDPKAARLDRLNAGAPVLDSHDRYSGVSAVLGVTGEARIEGGEGKVNLRFSRRAEVDGVWQDVQDKVLRNLSMGVTIHALEELERDEKTGIARFQATAWEPTEISVLGVGADPGAQISLSKQESRNTCEVTFRAEAHGANAHNRKDSNMEPIKVRLLADCEDGKKGAILEIDKSDFDLNLHTTELAPPKAVEPKAEPKGDPDEARARKIDEALAADKRHREDLKRVASHYGMDELWVQRQVNLGVDIDDAIESATKERAKLSPTDPNTIGFGNDYEAIDFKVESMSEALAARATRKEPTERARPYAGKTFAELALECLGLRGKARGLDARNHVSRIISAELALHTTSDFPLLLANVMNKMLLPEYAAAMPTYRLLAEQKSFNDFRPHQFLRSGDFPQLLKVNEHGEFKYGTMGENGEPVTAATYGRIIGLSRQTLINDDLAAFASLATKAARRLADFENATFFSTCITAQGGLGPDLSDGNAVYVSHNNTTAGGALSNTLLGEAYGKMKAQTSLDGLKLNIEPRYLLTSPTSAVLARTLLAAINPTQASEVNPFAGQIEAVADANLTSTRFYVLADPSVLANYVYGYIGGEGPRTETRSGFEVDGVEFKLALDFGVGAIDYRAGVTGAGS